MGSFLPARRAPFGAAQPAPTVAIPRPRTRDLSLAPFFGNSVACRLAEAHEIKHGTLVLGDWRAAQRIEFALNGNTNQNGHAGREDSPPDQAVGKAQGLLKVWVVNMHLDHDNTDNRHQQVGPVS